MAATSKPKRQPSVPSLSLNAVTKQSAASIVSFDNAKLALSALTVADVSPLVEHDAVVGGPVFTLGCIVRPTSHPHQSHPSPPYCSHHVTHSQVCHLMNAHPSWNNARRILTDEHNFAALKAMEPTDVTVCHTLTSCFNHNNNNTCAALIARYFCCVLLLQPPSRVKAKELLSKLSLDEDDSYELAAPVHVVWSATHANHQPNLTHQTIWSTGCKNFAQLARGAGQPERREGVGTLQVHDTRQRLSAASLARDCQRQPRCGRLNNNPVSNFLSQHARSASTGRLGARRSARAQLAGSRQ